MKSKYEIIYELFRIIDDIDTASDRFKEDSESFRKYVQKRQNDRWEHVDQKFIDELYEQFHPKGA